MVKDILAAAALPDLSPHGSCLLWRTDLVMLHAISDGLIAAAYYSIPAALIYFAIRRRDFRFRGMLFLFGLFILACGTTHVMDIRTLWHPDYLLAGYIKLFTAAVSMGTAISLWPMIPRALALPSPDQLAETNRQLQREIEERKRSEQQVHELNNELERRVEERTAQWRETNEHLLDRQQKLHQSRRRLRHILDTCPAAVYILEASKSPELPFQIAYIGSSIADITGYGPHDWYADPRFWVEHLHPDDRDRALANQHTLVANNELTHQYRFRHRDGSYRWIDDKIHLERDDEGKVVEAVGAWLDITERRQAELDLQQAKESAEAANHAKTEFLANISHELRTPLHAVLGFTQLLQSEPDSNPKRRDFINAIHRAGHYLTTLIEDLLDVSRIESGRLDIVKTIFGFNALLHGISETFAYQSAQKGLAFRFEPAANLPDYAYGDAKRLRQILVNLLSNAVKFTPAGRVVLRVEYRDETAYFEIEDTGPGIPAQDLERIFAPFERLQYHPSGGEGTGLGLALTYHLVEKLRGTLNVDSQPGQGSRFRVALPLPVAAKPQGRAIKGRIIGYQGERRRILLVDDVTDNIAILAAALEAVGFVTATASNGREALALLESFTPDLILLDLLMPEMDGRETVRHIRAAKDHAVRVVAVSANAFEATRRDCLAIGFDDFIAKPVELDTLFERIEMGLGLVWRYADA